MHMALGNEEATDTFAFGVSTDKATVKVDLCIGNRDKCLASRKQDMAFAAEASHSGSDGLNFFRSGKAHIGGNALITLLGYDANGTLIQVTDLRLIKATTGPSAPN